MKTLAVVLLIGFTAFGLAGVVDAQGGNSPAGTQAPAAPAPPTGSTAGGGSVSTPSTDAKGQVTTDRKSDAPAPPSARTDSGRSDDPAALPRSAIGDHTTIFGLSPAVAIVLAAALLVVVILAIVAMTRSDDTYIDMNRRI